MGFGRGRKRESWSSRPLSMLLSDNVKLFNKKGKATVEKAVQDQSRRGIEGGTIAGVEQPSLSEVRPTTALPANTYAVEQPAAKPPVEEAQQTATGQSEESSRLSALEVTPEPAPSKPVEAPYLTLNLGDTPKSLLDLSESYPSLDTSIHKDLDPTPTEKGPSSHVETQQHRTLSPRLSPEDTITPTQEAQAVQQDLDTGAPPVAELAAIDINQMPWAVNARDTPIIRESSTFEATEPLHDSSAKDVLSVPVDSTPELGYEAGSEVESPSLDSSNRQNSTFSSDTQPSLSSTADEFVLEPNRKIIVNRGVYILDPTNQHDLVHATLSPDELFNPFDFE